MHMNEKFAFGFFYALEVFRPNWCGRFLAKVLDLSRLSPRVLRLVTNFVGVQYAHNIIPTEGRNHILGVTFNAQTQVTTWFCGLFTNNYTPVAGDTMALFPAAAGETSAYTEATRPIWNEAAPAAGVVTNSASPAQFTFNATLVLFGAFMSSSSVKGGTVGTLVSAAKFAASKGVDSGDIGRLTASVTFTSS